MMKKKFGLVLAVVAVLLTGCVKCVSTETKTVQVQVVDEYYKEAEYRFLYNGQAVVPVNYPPLNSEDLKHWTPTGIRRTGSK